MNQIIITLKNIQCFSFGVKESSRGWLLFLINSALFGNFSEFRGEKRSLYIFLFPVYPPLPLNHPFLCPLSPGGASWI